MYFQYSIIWFWKSDASKWKCLIFNWFHPMNTFTQFYSFLVSTNYIRYFVHDFILNSLTDNNLLRFVDSFLCLILSSIPLLLMPRPISLLMHPSSFVSFALSIHNHQYDLAYRLLVYLLKLNLLLVVLISLWLLLL